MINIKSPHSLFYWITFLLISGILIMPGDNGLLSVWLSIYGLFYIKGFMQRVWYPSVEIGAMPIWIGMFIYVVYGIGIGIINQNGLPYFDAYVPMLLSPLIVNSIVVAKPSISLMWLGAAAAAILAGFIAAYQALYLEVGRAIGSMNNQIIFGDLAVIMGMFSLFGWLYWGRGKQNYLVNVFLWFGVGMGLVASLLSGTKGGWISILMLAVIFVWVAYSYFSWIKRLIIASAVLSSIFLFAYFMPHELVYNRIISGIQGGYIWFATGQITDGSVSIRFEMWYQAIGMIIDKPLTGWTIQGSAHELNLRLIEAGASAGVDWSQTENDFLQSGIVHGLPAMAAYIALYLGIILGFLNVKRSNHQDWLWVGLSTAGIVLAVLMVEFGLTIVALGRNAFRHALIAWSMIILGYLILMWGNKFSNKSEL